MIIGADVDAVVTQSMIDTASQETGASIQFWGRYFKEPGNTSPQQYQPDEEARLLHDRNIRLLPIGRQTNHVNGTLELGATDGASNANAVIEAVGVSALQAMPQGLFIFLDVEGPPHESLSAAYYRGWSGAVVQTARANDVTLLPGVYGAEGDSPTWDQLKQAVAAGAFCTGTWIARPGTIGCHPLHPFDENHVRPPGLPASIRVLIWQCVQECHNLDFNMLNPAFEADTLAKMVLPSAPPATV
jgi:hypothetical protein